MKTVFSVMNTKLPFIIMAKQIYCKLAAFPPSSFDKLEKWRITKRQFERNCVKIGRLATISKIQCLTEFSFH